MSSLVLEKGEGNSHPIGSCYRSAGEDLGDDDGEVVLVAADDGHA